MENYLAHHGIQGQKWGVRRGPPYPIENKVLSKGTKLASVSNWLDAESYRKSGRWLYTYNPEDKWDSAVYEGPFSIYSASRLGRTFITKYEFETVQDLKMPTSKERIDEFISLYQNASKKDRRIYAKDLEKVQRMYGGFDLDFKKLSEDKDFKRAYEVFNHAMERVDKFKMTSDYARIMSTKYDAMVDDNNVGIYNETHDPVIIFNAEKVLKSVGQTTLTKVDIMRNYRAVSDVLNAKGKPVMF